MRNLVSNLSVELPSLLLACGAIGLVVFYLGITDVQRRIGRDWKRVLARSLLLFVYGFFYACAGFFIHYGVNMWLQGGFDPARASLFAACALLLAHLVQLFWTESRSPIRSQ